MAAAVCLWRGEREREREREREKRGEIREKTIMLSHPQVVM